MLVFEIGAGFLKSGWRAALMFTLLRARIEAAAPLPSIGVMRIADALGDGTDMNIAVINVPAFLAVVCGSATVSSGIRH